MNIKKITTVIIGLIMIFNTVMASGATITVKEKTDIDASRSRYIIIMEDNGVRRAKTVTVTEKDAEIIENLDNTVLIQKDDVYVRGSKVENAEWQNFYDKTEHKKNTYSISENTEIPWNIEIINADDTDEVFLDNMEKIKIAIIDSGVDYSSYIDVCERKNFIPGEEEIPVIYEDASGHGTMIAGIIAAKDNSEGIRGINENVEIYSAKILDAENSAPVSRVVKAIYWAIEKNVDIINISFGTEMDSEALRIAIKDAYEEGILIIAAAGNKGNVEYPAAYDEVMAVGSVDSNGMVSENSAVGREVEIVAPGDQIVSTGAFDGVMTGSGTSFAAPHVVGVASVLMQKDKNISSDFIRKLMNFSANRYDSTEEYGNGLVDLEYALSCYDEFKKAYESSLEIAIVTAEKELKLETNTSEIVVYDNIDYVDGLWSKDKHAACVWGSTDILTSEELQIIKLGARYNDYDLSTVKGMTLNPQWHGYFQKKSNGVRKYYSNYVASYIWLTKCALGFKDYHYNTNSYAQPEQMSCQTDNDYNNMKDIITYSKVGNLSWSEVLNKSTYNLGSTQYLVTDRNKRLFVYGMALHTATDLYSHSSYDTSGSYISHASGSADDYEKISNRFACASIMGGYITARAANGYEGTVTDFGKVAYYSYNGLFYIRRLINNCKTTKASEYATFKKYIDAMDLSSCE